MFASVTVGSVPPFPYAAGPGSAPDDCGPTRRAFVNSGPWAIADAKKANISYDISPVPGFAGGKEAQPFVGVQAFYVAAKGKNKALAQEFVTNYVTKPELAVALYKAEPRPPALTAAFDQVKGEDPDLAAADSGGDAARILLSR